MLLFDLMEEARKEQGYPDQFTDWPKILRSYEMDEHKFLEQDEDGFIAANFTRSYYLLLDKPVCIEVAWYVTPEKRNSGIGMELYNKMEAWARKRGAEYILQGRSTKGCTKVGAFYLRELN